MITLKLALMILAMISFALAALNIPSPRANLMALGLFFLALAMVVTV